MTDLISSTERCSLRIFPEMSTPGFDFPLKEHKNTSTATAHVTFLFHFYLFVYVKNSGMQNMCLFVEWGKANVLLKPVLLRAKPS